MKYLIWVCICCSIFNSNAQIRLDKGVHLLDLDTWCYPLSQDSLNYECVLTKIGLATDENGLPKFSYLRYIQGNTHKIIFTCILTYPLPDTHLWAVALRKKLGQPKLKLQGFVRADSCRYTLTVALSAQPILISVSAPIRVGQTLTLTFGMNEAQANLLEAALKMPASNLRILMESFISGYSESFEGRIELDYEQLQSKVTILTPTESSRKEMMQTIEQLLQQHIIKIFINGNHTPSETRLHQIVDSLIDHLCEKSPNSLYQWKDFSKISSNYSIDITHNRFKKQRFTSVLDLGAICKKFHKDTRFFKHITE